MSESDRYLKEMLDHYTRKFAGILKSQGKPVSPETIAQLAEKELRRLQPIKKGHK